MSTLTPEFGATRGIYMDGWDSLDARYAREQQMRMDAQRTLSEKVLALTSDHVTIPSSWASMSTHQRDIVTALEAGEINAEEAIAHFEDIAQTTSE